MNFLAWLLKSKLASAMKFSEQQIPWAVVVTKGVGRYITTSEMREIIDLEIPSHIVTAPRPFYD